MALPKRKRLFWTLGFFSKRFHLKLQECNKDQISQKIEETTTSNRGESQFDMLFFPGNEPQKKRKQVRWIWSVPICETVGSSLQKLRSMQLSTKLSDQLSHWAMQAGSIPFEQFCLSQNVKPENEHKKWDWVNIPKHQTPKHDLLRPSVFLLKNCVANNWESKKISTFPSIPGPPISTT